MPTTSRDPTLPPVSGSGVISFNGFSTRTSTTTPASVIDTVRSARNGRTVDEALGGIRYLGLGDRALGVHRDGVDQDGLAVVQEVRPVEVVVGAVERDANKDPST
jgi:hypothetical protein